jgi:hypothetical protein
VARRLAGCGTTRSTTNPASGTRHIATYIPRARPWTRSKTRIVDYARAIKAIDQGALTIGPEEWGWSGYFYSGYDQQWGNAHGWGGSLPDRTAHGGWDFLPWLLDQLRRHYVATGAIAPSTS